MSSLEIEFYLVSTLFPKLINHKPFLLVLDRPSLRGRGNEQILFLQVFLKRGGDRKMN